jgi:transposase
MLWTALQLPAVCFAGLSWKESNDGEGRDDRSGYRTMFRTGRDLAAWIGLVPKQNSLGGKERLGSITRAGNRYLRQILVVGAIAVIRYAQRHGTRRPWLVQLLVRRPAKVAAVALANKNARMVWALMTSGDRYREPLPMAV